LLKVVREDFFVRGRSRQQLGRLGLVELGFPGERLV
jgi:hypothetical protein